MGDLYLHLCSMNISKNYTPLLIFTLLAIIWGSSFILIKRSLMVFSPFQIGSLRIVITFLALTPFVLKRLRGVNLKDWLYIGASGLTGSFFPAYLFAFAQQGINSSTAGILNSLTPLFALLIAVIFFKFAAKWWNYMGIIVTQYWHLWPPVY
jgi:drug/metabolite transporter (DMT)-like permease